MPRSLQEIIDHAEELADRFEQAPATKGRDAAPLRAIRKSLISRARAEAHLASAVAAAREAGHSWSAIGAILGTSGEAARQRYGGGPSRRVSA